MAKISINNGHTYTTADEMSDENISTHWDTLAQAMDAGIRASVHDEFSPCTGRQFLAAYLDRAFDDLVIG